LAQRGTYVGTTRSNASSSLDMIFNPAGALGGTANVLGVYNAYNRVRTMARSIETTTSWTRASTTLAPMNAAATGSGLNNRVSWVDGLQTSFVDATCAVLAFQGSGGSDPVLALALDSTTTAMAEIGATCGGVAEAILQAKAFITPQLGFHFVQALDGLSTGTAAETFFGKVSGMRPGSTNDFNLAYTSIELEM
jgi:hypothetical protein